MQDWTRNGLFERQGSVGDDVDENSIVVLYTVSQQLQGGAQDGACLQVSLP
jgi:hypothetical protein